MRKEEDKREKAEDVEVIKDGAGRAAGEKEIVLARHVFPQSLPIIPLNNRPLFPRMSVLENYRHRDLPRRHPSPSCGPSCGRRYRAVTRYKFRTAGGQVRYGMRCRSPVSSPARVRTHASGDIAGTRLLNRPREDVLSSDIPCTRTV